MFAHVGPWLFFFLLEGFFLALTLFPLFRPLPAAALRHKKVTPNHTVSAKITSRYWIPKCW